jgi:hypothetical protein
MIRKSYQFLTFMQLEIIEALWENRLAKASGL